MSCAGVGTVESRLREARRFVKPLACSCRPMLLVDMADRPFLMQGSAWNFYPIHAYVSIMLTPIRQAHLTRGHNAYH